MNCAETPCPGCRCCWPMYFDWGSRIWKIGLREDVDGTEATAPAKKAATKPKVTQVTLPFPSSDDRLEA